MKSVLMALVAIVAISHASAADIGFMTERNAKAMELFNVPNGENTLTILMDIQKSRQVSSQNEEKLCGPGGFVESIQRANSQIVALGKSEAEVAIKNSYKLNKISSTVEPYEAYCKKSIDAEELIKQLADAKVEEVELQFMADFMDALMLPQE